MLGKKRDQEIDAVDELEKIEGEHGPSNLGSQRRQSPPGSRLFLLVILILIMAVGGTFTYKALSLTKKKTEEKPKEQAVSKVIPEIKPRKPVPEITAPPQPIQVVPAQPPRNDYRSSEKREKTPAELARERMFSSSLGGSSSNSPGRETAGSPQEKRPVSELEKKLTPVQLSGSSAAVLPERDFLITRGTTLDCVLVTKLITTQPGMASCRLTRDVYSTSGRVVLLERGSLVTGLYQGGMTQGQARIFVQWSRVETPRGVVIDLASPGTGPLGEGGVGGWVDTHFWQRFGGALLISMIGDLGDWASRAGSRQGDNSIQFSNTTDGAQQAVTEALKNSINIPPTLYKSQGERVSIFVARDLDFSSVYSLEVKGAEHG